MYASKTGKRKRSAASIRESDRTSRDGGHMPDMMMQMQRTIGNRAVTRMMQQAIQDEQQSQAINTNQTQDTEPVVQRATLGGQPIRPYGKSGKELWEKTKYALFNHGLSPHGAKNVFFQVVDTNLEFENAEHFVDYFMMLANEEVARVDRDKNTLPKEQQTRGWTRRLKLNRPSWTKAHKANVQQGEDIRHVVRNATIRNALEAEYLAWMKQDETGEQAFQVFTYLANSIGIHVQATHAREIMKSIYDALYLNAGNLFAGPGAVNRVIGLTADTLEGIGREYLNNDSQISAVKIEQIFEKVAYIISQKSDQMEQVAEKSHYSEEREQRFLDGLDDFFDTISDYLVDAEFELLQRIESGEEVLAFEVGWIIMEIGANFGFDIPLVTMSGDPRHMEVLIQAEQFFSQYQGGRPEELAHIMRNLMGLKQSLFEQRS